VHRAPKPSNLVVAANGEVKLLDLGIAFLAGETTPERVQPYTPRYAAPDQRAGRDVTTTTDVYALGLVLGELLDSAAAASGPVPADLLAIARRASADEPAARYPTVAALAEDLRRYGRHEPVIAHHGGTWNRATRFARRHTTGLTVAALARCAIARRHAGSWRTPRVMRPRSVIRPCARKPPASRCWSAIRAPRR
jgi:serine/threonine protein kinase